MNALASSPPNKNTVLVDGEFQLTQGNFDRIAKALYDDAGIYLPEGKSSMMYSRLAKRVRKLQLSGFDVYCDLVESPDGASERYEMMAALTTNLTSFFREPHHFDHLRDNVMPELAKKAAMGGRVRLWSAACSNGSEPYSMALMVLSAMPDAHNKDIKILATDIDPNMIAKGRAGIYPANDLASVPQDLRNRYFEAVTNEHGESCYSAGPELRKLITFNEMNLNISWPMKGKFDAILCRNVVIYFDLETQQKIWLRFAGQLQRDGWLYIGHSERVTGRAEDLFVTEGITTYKFCDVRK